MNEAVLSIPVPAVAAHQSSRQAAEVAAVQEVLRTTTALHCCSGAAWHSSGSRDCSLVPTGTYEAVYHGPLGIAGWLEVAAYRCGTCGREVSVHPLQVSCQVRLLLPVHLYPIPGSRLYQRQGVPQQSVTD